MRNTVKKTVSLLLVLLMVLGCVWSAFTVTAASDQLFKDDFSSSALSGWGSTSVGQVSGGQYVINGTGSNHVATLGSVKTVAVLADVKVETAKDQNGTVYASGMTSLLFHASNDLSTGYEFGLGVSKNGTTYAILYRTVAGTSEILTRRTTKVPGTDAGKIVAGKTYGLKVIMEGNTFECYINNELFYTYTDHSLTQGAVGVAVWNAKGTFDNFEVHKAGNKVLKSIRLENTPAEISVAGDFNLDIIAEYEGVYGSRRYGLNTPGVKVTGIDGKLGQKTLTVSYGGKSATFTTNVVKNQDGALLYEDNFDTAANWTLSTIKVGEKAFQFKAENGRLVAVMPSSSGFDKSAGITADLTNAADLLAEPYFAAEVDAVITSNSTSATYRDGLAEIYACNIGGVEYRFRVLSNGNVRLYAGSTLKADTTVSGIALNKTFKMRVEVRGNQLAFYVNNALALDYSDASQDVLPLLRLALHNGSAYFDNYKVLKLEKKSKWAIRQMDVVDTSGKIISSYTGYTFTPANIQLRVSYYDSTTAILPVTNDMLSGYDASSRNKQNIKIVYGNFSKNFSILFSKYLFYNDFSDGMKGLVDVKNTYAESLVRNGKLLVQYTEPEDGRTVSKAINIPNCDTFSDYAVSADVILSSGGTRKTLYAGFTLRTGGGGTTYTYRLTCSSGEKPGLALLHNEGDGNREIRYWGNNDLLTTFPLDAEYAVVDINTQVNLKIELIDNVIYCYFNNVLLDVIIDDSKNYKKAAGGIQINTINANAMYDNIYVTPLGERKVTNVAISGQYAVDGALQVYQGYEVEPNLTDMVVNYNDGLQITLPLWKDYIIENYDPNRLGKQEMTLSYMGMSAKVPVTVVERPDYVSAFVDKVNHFKKGSLTLADDAALTELVGYFGTLTPYEVKNLGGSVYKDYVDLVSEMDLLKSEELKDVDLVYYNDFTETEDMSQWGAQTRTGETFSRNGYLTSEMKRFGVAGNALFYNKNTYSEIKSVEVDAMMLYPSTFVALTVYSTQSTYYHLRLTNKYADENNQRIYTLQLYKYNGAQIKLAQTYPILKGVEVEEGKWNNLRMNLDNGLITAYVDDVMMFQYDDSSSVDYITDGYIGIRTSENDGRYDNMRLYGIKKEVPRNSYEKQITPTEYTDDFEDETVGQNPSHWVEDNETDDWKVMNKGGSKVYGTTVKSKPVYTWLHAFEEDPVYKAKFLTGGTNSGKIGFITRMYDETGYLAIGYNLAEKKWFTAATMGVDMDTVVVYAEETSALTAGEWHEMEIKLQDVEISVLVDGKEVFAQKNLACKGFGRMGFFANGADMYVDDVYVKSVNGTNFNDGVVEYNIEDELFLSSMSIQDLGNGMLIGCQNGAVYISYDDGKTFAPVDSNSPYSGVGVNAGGYVTLFEIGKNHFLKVVAMLQVYESTDGMKSWTEIGHIIEEDDSFYDPGTGVMLPIIHTGSMTKVTLPNGNTRLFMAVAMRTVNSSGSILGHYSRFFYSDDWGRTWTEAQNDTRDVLPAYNNNTTLSFAEGKIIQCSDGSIRFYQTRNKNGCALYIESKDYGETWTEFGRIPNLQCPMGSFGIEEDPTAPGTYYMAYVNSTPRAFGGVFPRTRLTLVKTTDGKNWEFVTDIERTTDWAAKGSEDIRQFLDPDVCVTEDYIYVTYGRCAKYYDGSSHNAQRPRLVRFERDKLSTRPWDDATLADSTYVDTIEIAKLPQTKFGYGDLFNNIGLEFKLTAVNGMTTIEGPKEYFMIDGEPNMFKMGKQTVRLLSKHYCVVAYEIEIVPNYNLIWTIKGKGTIDPDPEAVTRMMEGSEQTFTLKPAKGYKVGSVTVNGQSVKVTKKTFTISNVQEDQEITVSFVKLGFIDYLPYILIGIVVVAGIAVGAIFLIKKQKKSAVAEENIDISSHSAPTDDQE